jgi:hypothetical protein
MKVKGRGRFREVEDPDGYDYMVLVEGGKVIGCVVHGTTCKHFEAVVVALGKRKR